MRDERLCHPLLIQMAGYTGIRLPNDAPSLDLDGPAQSEGDAASDPVTLRRGRERRVIDYLVKTFESEVLVWKPTATKKKEKKRKKKGINPPVSRER